MARIALLGTGMLGSGMVRHFLKSGTQVTVWNRTEEKARALAAEGATVAASPAAAVAGASRVHFVLPDDAVVDGHPRSDRAGAEGRRGGRRSLDDAAGRDGEAGRASPRPRDPLPARAGLHVAADGRRRRRADAGLGTAARVRRGARGARGDDRRGLVSRRAARSRRRLQAVRQLHAVRDQRRAGRHRDDGARQRHRSASTR